ncbi:MAG: hypothetical protein IJ719_21685 [Clostridia bacterium]|nr:hypothetical protein [Clostridia bacterium]
MISTKRVNISLQYDTLDRLDQYAFEQHVSRSQAITNLVWKAKVDYQITRGQVTIEEYMASLPGGSKK